MRIEKRLKDIYGHQQKKARTRDRQHNVHEVHASAYGRDKQATVNLDMSAPDVRQFPMMMARGLFWTRAVRP